VSVINHPASHRVEQPAEQQRPEEIAGRERQHVPSDLTGGDPVEVGQYQGESKEDGIVEKRLRDHQGHADQRALAIDGEQRACRLTQRCVVAHLQF